MVASVVARKWVPGLREYATRIRLACWLPTISDDLAATEQPQ